MKGCSDFNLKEVFPEITDEMISVFAKINPIKFHYKPEAQELYEGEKGVDNKEHIGVKAQELEVNPITSGTVSEDENGFKQVDIRHLTFSNTAMISELCKKIEELSKKIEILEKVQ